MPQLDSSLFPRIWVTAICNRLNLFEQIEKFVDRNLLHNKMSIKELDLIGEWPAIPPQAFLYFPSGEQLKSGKNEKQWRKIFDVSDYDEFEVQNLALLDNFLRKYKIEIHPWFDRANQLRFLQANKFKISDTCKAIEQGSRWRKQNFPLQVNSNAEKMLHKGCSYFCGRDQYYRPVLVVDITKFNESNEDNIPAVLMIMLEYMIKELLIPGQVENYIILIDLTEFQMSMRNTISKIMSFTSNTYRGRLYASYLLGMPSMLNMVWNSLASKFVSENTLKKIKITRERENPEMWTHIDRSKIEIKFGGSMPNITQYCWPPQLKLLNQELSNGHVKHITKSEYQQKYLDGNLENTKLQIQFLNLVDHDQNCWQNAGQPPASEILTGSAQPSNTIGLAPQKIKKEPEVSIKQRDFELFFASDKFKQLLNLQI